MLVLKSESTRSAVGHSERTDTTMPELTEQERHEIKEFARTSWTCFQTVCVFIFLALCAAVIIWFFFLAQ